MSGAIEITGVGADDEVKRLDERNKGAVFKNFTPFNSLGFPKDLY